VRIAYIGQLWDGSTTAERAGLLAERGHELLRFDTTPYLTAGWRVSRAIQNRLLAGPVVNRFNRDLRHFIGQAGRLEVVWLDKARWVFADTLGWIKQQTRARVVHYTPDPAFVTQNSRHFEQSVPLYDLCVTTKRYELQRYRDAGAQSVMFTWQGIDDRFANNARAARLNSGTRSGVVFVGHRERHYVATLSALAMHGIELTIRGPRWTSRLGIPKVLKPHVAGEGVWGASYVDALAAGKIGLGLLSKWHPDQFTTRTFEIPASGTMLLAERTPEHLELFEEGREAEYFTSPVELVEKARYYLAHESERMRIATAGRAKAVASFHWSNVLRPVLEFLERPMGR
jgi:spore maturation protein CgeB